MEDEQRQEGGDCEEGPAALSPSVPSPSSSSGVSYGHRLSEMDPLLREISENFVKEQDVKQLAERLLGKKGLEMFEANPFDSEVSDFWPALALKLICQWCKQRQEADQDGKRSNDLVRLVRDLNRDDLLAQYWEKLDAKGVDINQDEDREAGDEMVKGDSDSKSSDDITPPAKRQKSSDHEVWVPPPLMPYLTWHCMKMIAACFGDDFAKAKGMAEVMLDRGNELLLHRLATKPGQTTEKYVLEVLDVYRRQHGNGADCVSLLRLALKAEFKMPEAADCLLLT